MKSREISRSKIGPFSLACTDPYIGIGWEYQSTSQLISSQSINLYGRPSTTDDIETISFHLLLSSTAFRESPNSTPVHFLLLSFISSPVFLSLLLALSPAELNLPCHTLLVLK